MSLENKRIFLFSRRIIADESLKPCIRPRGSSNDIPQPEPISGTVDASHIVDIIKDEALVNKLVEYIKFFRSELHKCVYIYSFFIIFSPCYHPFSLASLVEIVFMNHMFSK